MLRRATKGSRRTRTVIGSFFFLVLAVCTGILVTRATVQRPPNDPSVAPALAAVEKRVTEHKARVEQTKQIAFVQPAPKEGSARTRAISAYPDLNSELLTLIAKAYFSRDESACEEAYRTVQDGVASVVTANTATPFARAVAAHIQSRDEVLQVVGDYIRTIPQLEEAEQAVNSGQDEINGLTGCDDYYTSAYLISLLSLRGLAELHAGDPQQAFATCLYVYDFTKVRMQGDERPHCSTFLPFPQGTDLLLEHIVDAAWKLAPLTPDEREQALNRVGWHPAWSDIADAVYRNTKPSQKFGWLKRDSLEVFTALTQWQDTYTHDAALVATLELSLGKPPSELKATQQTFLTGLPPDAASTRVQAEAAFTAYAGFWSRAMQADVARLAFALKDYQSAHGTYPESLAEGLRDTIPPLPTDPISGLSLQYHVTEKGFSITRTARNDTQAVVWEARE